MKIASFVVIGALVAIFAAAACENTTNGYGGGGAGGYGGGGAGGAECLAYAGDPCDSAAEVDPCCAPLYCSEQNQCE